LREGELHPGVLYTQDKRLAIAEALADIGVSRIEFPLVYPQRGGRIPDINDAIDLVQNIGATAILQFRAYRPDLELATKFNARGAGVFLAISEEQKAKIGNMTDNECLERLSESLLFLKDLYNNSQQTTARIQEILKDFDILKFNVSKEYSSEIEKALLKGRVLIDAEKFEEAFVALCDCLNLNKTALNTVVNSTESLLKELNCNSIQSTVEILTGKYNFSRESILKLILRLVLLQRLEIDGKFVWSKEEKLLQLKFFKSE